MSPEVERIVDEVARLKDDFGMSQEQVAEELRRKGIADVGYDPETGTISFGVSRAVR